LELACREAGKNWPDGVAEIREAVDFLNYYATQSDLACEDTDARGVFVCISPWNFPLAIFIGQVAAALVTGNAVLAKPAEQTPLIAARAVQLLHEAGVPRAVLQFLPGDGAEVGGPLTARPEIAGVAFTGSLDVAHLIDRQLAKTAAPDAALIAETGGINAMIVDSTALPEQAVRDILASAFQSAGQRCSALRTLYVQKDVEARLLPMLEGAMDALVIGRPADLATDVGPVIEAEAREAILDYCHQAEQEGRLLKKLEAPIPGCFVAPHLIRVGGIEDIPKEIFGPVLHVASFDAEKIEAVIDAINASGYGLTFGLHTRIDARVQHLLDHIQAGNAYVNRNQIGAIVGSQPFGGEGLSGTGPKAGGPHYLRRFRKTPAVEGNAPAAPTVAHGVLKRHLAQLRQSPNEVVDPTILRRLASAAFEAASQVETGPIDLPGPTGESNRLQIVPRGVVLCLGDDLEAVIGHAVQARAMGNRVLVVAEGAEKALVGADGMRGIDGAVEPSDLTELAIDLVAASGPADWLGRLRRALAA
ncbi:MAG: L-glutamate gamma-semialdehyde dehydrogenase, partial [Pseudomonadota bacterium]